MLRGVRQAFDERAEPDDRGLRGDLGERRVVRCPYLDLQSVGTGDLDRAANQRNVIKAIVTKGLSAGVIADPARFSAFVGNLARHLTVDDTLTDSAIRSTALSLRLTAKDIALLQAPISGFDTVDGQSIDVVDTAKLAELAKAMKDDTMAAYVEKYPKG